MQRVFVIFYGFLQFFGFFWRFFGPFLASKFRGESSVTSKKLARGWGRQFEVQGRAGNAWRKFVAKFRGFK